MVMGGYAVTLCKIAIILNKNAKNLICICIIRSIILAWLFLLAGNYTSGCGKRNENENVRYENIFQLNHYFHNFKYLHIRSQKKKNVYRLILKEIKVH